MSKESVAIVSHDVGGAEILSSWLNHNDCNAYVVARGPAKKIFKKKCNKLKFFKLDDALNKSNWLLAGTGWQTNFEIQAISKARKLGIKTVAFLDHWVNYRERFKFNGSEILPDEIWVGDKDAERLAKNIFCEIPIVMYPNPYFKDLKAEIALKKNKNKINKYRILYVCEPIAEHSKIQYGSDLYSGYTEQEALNYFLKNISIFYKSIQMITIRPHPSENKKKYLWAKKVSNLSIKFGGKEKLVDEIISADIVVGCESMALIVALLAGKSVASTIPPGGRPCQLPHSKIQTLEKLIQTKFKYYD